MISRLPVFKKGPFFFLYTKISYNFSVYSVCDCFLSLDLALSFYLSVRWLEQNIFSSMHKSQSSSSSVSSKDRTQRKVRLQTAVLFRMQSVTYGQLCPVCMFFSQTNSKIFFFFFFNVAGEFGELKSKHLDVVQVVESCHSYRFSLCGHTTSIQSGGLCVPFHFAWSTGFYNGLNYLFRFCDSVNLKQHCMLFSSAPILPHSPTYLFVISSEQIYSYF